MTIIVSALIQATEQNHRNQTAAVLNPRSSDFDVSTGIHFGLNIAKTTGMGATISTGRCVAPNYLGGIQGPYTIVVTAAETITFANGDASRNRIDLVVIGVEADKPTVGSVRVVQGVYPVSGSPIVPDTPVGTVALWNVPINAGMSAGSGGWTTSLAVDVRYGYAARGGRILVANQRQRDLIPKYPNLSVFRADTNLQESWTGTSWVDTTYSDYQVAFSGAPFAWSSGVSWDAGPLSVDTRGYISSQISPINTFASPGTLSGTIKFNEPGIYDVIWYNVTGGDPGNSGYRIVASGAWPGGLETGTPGNVLGQDQHIIGAHHWETTITAINIRVPIAGLQIRFIGVQQIATVNEARIRVTKKSSL